MRLIVCKDYDDMSRKAADMIASQIILKPNTVLGLATGSTPIGTYQRLVAMYKKATLSFNQVTTFNLDEYYPIKKDNTQSYAYFMNENLFNHIDIDKGNTNIPNGESEDPEHECARYELLIKSSPRVDLQLLGIGQNGHIGFNEPGEQLITHTHLTDLTQNTIDANARFFKSRDEVPKQAITMGISTIFRSRKIILLASGENKQDAVRELLTNKITTTSTATMLKVHHDVVLLCDEAAYGNGDEE